MQPVDEIGTYLVEVASDPEVGTPTVSRAGVRGPFVTNWRVHDGGPDESVDRGSGAEHVTFPH